MFAPESFVSKEIQKIKKEVLGKAVIAVSGGIDSTVAAKVASEALDSEVLAIYVDTGLMRLDEEIDVQKTLADLGINHKIVKEEELFLGRLKGVTDPETKRKIIGKTFIDVFEREAKDFGAKYLVQGTIAPDWIESGGGLRDTIKSHHNVGGLPDIVNLKIVEPLRDLYKDEVRKIADYYGIPKMRQPFPGPGLAVRIIGEVTRDRVDLLKKATSILEKNVSKFE